jgi:hypothetical protein
MVLGALGREHGGRIGERDDSCINLQIATADGEYGRGVMNFPISHFLGIAFKNIGQKRRNSLAKFDVKEKKNRRKTRWQPQIVLKDHDGGGSIHDIRLGAASELDSAFSCTC